MSYEVTHRKNVRGSGEAPDLLWCSVGAMGVAPGHEGELVLGVGFAGAFLDFATQVMRATGTTVPVQVLATDESPDANYEQACRIVWPTRKDPHAEAMAVIFLGCWPDLEKAHAVCGRFIGLPIASWCGVYHELLQDAERTEPPVGDEDFVRDMCSVFMRECVAARTGVFG